MADSTGAMSQEDQLALKPISLQMINEIVEDDFTQGKLEDNPLWPFVSKTCKLTFIDEPGAFALSQLLEAEVCKAIRNKPPCEQDNKFYMEIGQGRIIGKLNIMRAKGTDKAQSMLNERIANISQNIHYSGLSQQTQSSGLMGRLKSMGRRR